MSGLTTFDERTCPALWPDRTGLTEDGWHALILPASVSVAIFIGYQLFRAWRFRNYERLGYTVAWYNCGFGLCDYCPHEYFRLRPGMTPWSPWAEWQWVKSRPAVSSLLLALVLGSYTPYVSSLGLCLIFSGMASLEIYLGAVTRPGKGLVGSCLLLFANASCASYALGCLLLFRTCDPTVSSTLSHLYLVNSLSDAAQYAGGKLLGRTLAFPSISPNKTWEGYLVGTFVTLPLGWWLTGSWLMTLVWLVLGYAGGLLSSATKRQLGLKHWSWLLGEHGGFADRTDSLALVGAAMWLGILPGLDSVIAA